MFEVKKGGITIFVEQTKLVGDCAVGLCFTLKANCCSLQKLNGSVMCNDGLPIGAEEAALAYALQIAVREKLCGGPVAVSKSGVGDVACCVHDDKFTISWKVKGTVSAVRKSVGIALKVLNPAKMFPAWSKNIKFLGGKADKEEFAYVADAAASAIKSALTIGVVGKINIDAGKLKDMSEVLSKKVNVSNIAGKKSKPEKHEKCNHSDCTELKVSGWHCFAIADYINSKAKGVPIICCDGKLFVKMSESQYKTLSSKLSEGLSAYIKSNYEHPKIGDNLPAIIGYLGLSSCKICPCDVKSVISSKVTAKMIESAIKKAI